MEMSVTSVDTLKSSTEAVETGVWNKGWVYRIGLLSTATWSDPSQFSVKPQNIPTAQEIPSIGKWCVLCRKCLSIVDLPNA